MPGDLTDPDSVQQAAEGTDTLSWADQIRSTGVVRWAYGQAARSLIHERDLADVAVRALTDDKHAGATYVLTGARARTFRLWIQDHAGEFLPRSPRSPREAGYRETGHR